jgi:hypothetical protein
MREFIMSETRIGLLRIQEPWDISGWPYFTVGKVYPVVAYNGRGSAIVFNNRGGEHVVGELDSKRFWKQVWLLPDGTAVEVLE